MDVVFSLTFLVIAATWVILIGGIIDAARRPVDAWSRAGQNKGLWIALQIFLGIIGAAVYFLSIRPKVAAADLNP
jgi:hypothetical protein